MDPNPSSILSRQAINAALDSKWEEALKLNRQIFKVDPTNIDALNRQARAYFELGKINLAKKYYSLALKSDPYNPIAQKNLKIIKTFKNTPNQKQNVTDPNYIPPERISPLLFLHEPGKTKIVNLLKLAEPHKLSLVYPGMYVEMSTKNHRMHITDKAGNYLGILPDDLSHQLLRLIEGGNKFGVFIKSVRVNALSVLIRETFRSKKFKNQSSFLENNNAPLAEIITPINMDDSDDDESEENEEQEV